MLNCKEWPTGDVYPFMREIKLTQKKKKAVGFFKLMFIFSLYTFWKVSEIQAGSYRVFLHIESFSSENR